MKEVVNEMNERQRRFADEYIIHANVFRAAVNAGYSENYAKTDAHKILDKPSVKAYLDERLEVLQSKAIADQREVLEYLTSTMRGELTDEELMVVGHGQTAEVQRHEKRSDTTQRTKAAELLGKRYALFTDKQQVEHSGGVNIYDDYK